MVLVLPQSYFLSRAQSLCGPERSAVPDSLRWLCHPLGQKFFMERSWSVKSAAKESLYCAQRNPGENALPPGGPWCCPQTHGDTGYLGREFPTLRSSGAWLPARRWATQSPWSWHQSPRHTSPRVTECASGILPLCRALWRLRGCRGAAGWPHSPASAGKQTDIDGAVREQQAADGRQVLRVVAEIGLRASGGEAGWLSPVSDGDLSRLARPRSGRERPVGLAQA